MQNIILILLTLFFSQKLVSQTFAEGCLSQNSQKARILGSEEISINYQMAEDVIYTNKSGPIIKPRADFIIPVVFHVVWNNEEENISTEQILSQLDALNDAFLAKNQNVTFIPDIFKSTIGNTGLAFCLANEDPFGNEHSGINRINTDYEFIGDIENLEGKPRIKYTSLGGIDAWDTNSYINIWIGKKELGFGEATFPGSSVLQEQGLIIDPFYIGTEGTADTNPNFNRGHVLVHEMGHYFNLRHLFGEDQNCDNDDGIEDTPLQSTSYSDCPLHPQISCNSADMIMNFMALTNDLCTRFFTKGQKQMILLTLDNQRSGLKNIECSQLNTNKPIEDKISIKYLFGLDIIELELYLAQSETIELTLFDLLGRSLTKEKLSFRFYYNLDISTLVSGVYFLNLQIGDERIIYKFFKP